MDDIIEAILEILMEGATDDALADVVHSKKRHRILRIVHIVFVVVGFIGISAGLVWMFVEGIQEHDIPQSILVAVLYLAFLGWGMAPVVKKIRKHYKK